MMCKTLIDDCLVPSIVDKATRCLNAQVTYIFSTALLLASVYDEVCCVICLTLARFGSEAVCSVAMPVLDIGYANAVNALEPSACMDSGWKSIATRGPFSNPWIDHWCVGSAEHVNELVRDARPYAMVQRRRQNMLILHKGVYPLSDGRQCLGWVQVLVAEPSPIAFDAALFGIMRYYNWYHS